MDAANNQPAIDFGAWGVGDDAAGAGGRAADEVVPAPMEPPVFSGPVSGGVSGVGSVGPPRPDAGLPSAGPKPGAGGACKVANSFVPGTKVVMADGSAKPIEKIKLRDKVLAADPVTGERGAREVVATIIGEGEKRLVELTVDTDGGRGDATGTVVATDGHPFWVPDLREWKTAGELRAGSLLQTSAGTWVQVVTVAERIQQQRVHNLTVDDLHTYHVVVGETSTLVHNTGPDGCGPDSLPVHRPGTLSDRDARAFYLEGERGIAALGADLLARGVSPRERALELIQTRNALRTHARDVMANRERAARLDITDPNRTLDQLVLRAYREKGLRGDAMWNYLADSASRSRASVNQRFGLTP